MGYASKRGHFYVAKSGHFYFAITLVGEASAIPVAFFVKNP